MLNKSSLYALILAGGRGKRLWPKSKKIFPKHFISFTSKYSLLQETYRRLDGFIPPEHILIVTLKEQINFIKKQIPQLKNMIVEPEGKNTLSSILLGEIFIKNEDPQAILIVLPSDHFIKPRDKFLKILSKAKEFIERKDGIVTLGIKPDYPETGYGYIKIYPQKIFPDIYKVERFIEKPDLKKAKIIFQKNEYFWNLGIFIFRAGKALEETKRFFPYLYKEFISLKEKIGNKREWEWTLKNIYRKIPSQSFDQAILEKSKSVYMLKADFSWVDLGSWLSLERILKKDSDKNVSLGNNFLYHTDNSIIVNEENNHLLVASGLSNTIVVHTPKVTLIYPKTQNHEFKKLFKRLEEEKKFKEYL